MGFSAASSCVRLMDSRMLSSSPMDCKMRFTGSYTRVTTSRKTK